MLDIPSDDLRRTIQGVVDNYLVPHFTQLGMNATGDWINALEVRVNGNSAEIWGLDYTQYLVNGRGPNKKQDTDSLRRFAVWAGSTFIKDWAIAKGVQAPPIAIAYKIAREGTSYYPQGTDLLEVLESQEVLNYIYKELRVALAGYMRAEIIRKTKQAFA